MDASAIAQLISSAVVFGLLGTLFWARLNRIEEKLDRKMDRDEFGEFRMQIRNEFGEFRSEMREEFAQFRREIRGDLGDERAERRGEIAALRSDLTQIALAVGAKRPQVS